MIETIILTISINSLSRMGPFEVMLMLALLVLISMFLAIRLWRRSQMSQAQLEINNSNKPSRRYRYTNEKY